MNTALQPFKQLIYDYSGLLIEGAVAEERLLRYLERTRQLLGLELPAFYRQLQHSATELDALMSELTVNETYFFRENDQIRLLVNVILPRLRALAGVRPLRILSAGCSSGEEPYSLAMSILEHHGQAELDRVQIDAGDLDLGILAKAQRALYSPFSFRGVDPVLRDRYFDQEARGYRLHDTIRQSVRFFMLNLKADSYPADGGLYDVIFFRNVSIYFDTPTRVDIQRKFSQIMQPDALLFLGSAETLGNDFGLLELAETNGLYYFVQGEQLLPAQPASEPVSRPVQPVSPRPTAPAAPSVAPAPAAPAPRVEPEAIRELLQQERYAEADSKLDLLLTHTPNVQPALLMKAWVALNARHWQHAESLLHQVLGTQQWQLDALLAMGLSMKWQEQLEQACDWFKKAAYAHSESWLAQYFHGDCLRLLEQPRPARAALQIARRILASDLQADPQCRWLPLAPPARDALFLIERQLLALGQTPSTPS